MPTVSADSDDRSRDDLVLAAGQNSAFQLARRRQRSRLGVQLERVAVPDARGDRAVTTKPTGSGLVLALSREIVELHQGRLALARRDGGGMSVSVWLPGAEGTAAAALAASRARLTLTRS